MTARRLDLEQRRMAELKTAFSHKIQQEKQLHPQVSQGLLEPENRQRKESKGRL